MVNYYLVTQEIERNKEIKGELKKQMTKCLVEITGLSEELKKRRTDLEIMNQEIKRMESRSESLNLMLKDLNLKLKKNSEICANTVLIKPIIVNDDFSKDLGPRNGLVNLNRDILMKLIRIFDHEEKVRNIIGIGTIFYGWSKQRIFRWARVTGGLEIIGRWLGRPSKFKLLYSAARDGFSGTTFHKKCNRQGATVTIITSTEGWVFGRYAAVSWMPRSGRNSPWLEDCSKQSFLFSLKNPRNEVPTKFGLLNDAYALYYGDSYGPCFGHTSCGIICCLGGNVSWTLMNGEVYAKASGVKGDEVFTGKSSFEAKNIEVYQVVQK